MGAWHTREERRSREWVLYISGIVALLVIAGVAAAVVVTAKKGSGSSSGGSGSGGGSGAAVVAATPVAARPPLAAGQVAEQSTPTAKPPPPPPSLKASPPPQSPPPPQPTAQPPPPAPPAPQLASPPAPRPASPPPAARPPPPPLNTYDPSFSAIATTNNVPPAPGFIPVVVNPSYERTCQLRTDKNWLCNDGIATGAVDTTDISLLRLLGDPTQMEACGFADMSVIANSLVAWAYKKKCGVEAYTIVRACIGIPGSAGDGHWRARVMLWPKAGSPNPACTPLCIKMRGNQNTVTDYGRHASCNEQTS